MRGQATCSLSEALTVLAFNAPTPARLVPKGIQDGRWSCCPTAARSGLMKAVRTLCDAGYRGDVAIFGRTTVFSFGVSADPAPLRPLTKGECEAFRLFVPGQDALWEGKNRGNEMKDAFAAHASSEGLDDVRVDLSDLSRLMVTRGASGSGAVTPSAVPSPFTDAEIDDWIGSTSLTHGKKARNAFMKEQRAKGLSATFEARWKAIKKKPVGRPRAR
jgi:hypothetical protein